MKKINPMRYKNGPVYNYLKKYIVKMFLLKIVLQYYNSSGGSYEKL